MSKCYGALKLMKDDYSEYTHSQGRDHDELSRRLDVVNNHWMWLKRIVNRYENQHKSIASQTDKFDDGKLHPSSLYQYSWNVIVRDLLILGLLCIVCV